MQQGNDWGWWWVRVDHSTALDSQIERCAAELGVLLSPPSPPEPVQNVFYMQMLPLKGLRESTSTKLLMVTLKVGVCQANGF